WGYHMTRVLWGGLSAAVLAYACLMVSPAAAQQLVYTPKDPTFGGNPFNSSHLFGLANAQNPFTNRGTQNLTQAQLFAPQLQSRILADLADQVTNAIFGPNAQDHGTYSFGGETVSFVRTLEGTTVTITDASGAVTTMTVPNTTQVQ